MFTIPSHIVKIASEPTQTHLARAKRLAFDERVERRHVNTVIAGKSMVQFEFRWYLYYGLRHSDHTLRVVYSSFANPNPAPPPNLIPSVQRISDHPKTVRHFGFFHVMSYSKCRLHLNSIVNAFPYARRSPIIFVVVCADVYKTFPQAFESSKCSVSRM